MAALRNKSIVMIEEALKSSKFTRHAFTINDSVETGNFCFEITFDHDKRYRFYCTGGPGSWNLKQSPGDILFEDDAGIGGPFDNVVAAVRTWVRRLDEDIDLTDTWTPHCRAMKNELENFLVEHPEGVNERFSTDEVKAILDHLRQMEIAYEALLEKQEITEEEMERLRDTVEALRNELSYVTRGTWYRLLLHRNLDISEGLWKTPAVQQLALEAGKTLIQESVRSILRLPASTNTPKQLS
jgi:hypothetical protein